MAETIVADGSNVAHVERSADRAPKVENLTAVVRLLGERGYDPIVIVDGEVELCEERLDPPDRR